MSTRVRISELPHHVGEVVQLLGWVRFRRSSGTKLHFLQLRDGSGFVQAVVKKGNVPEAVLDAAGKVPLESAVSITGTVREDTRQVGGVEVTVDGLDVLAPCVDDFPIGKKDRLSTLASQNLPSVPSR